MVSFAAAAALWISLGANSVSAQDSSSAAAVREGCEKRCEKTYVPCTDARVDDQMMCLQVVKRCEIRCEPKRSSPTTASRKPQPRR